MLTSLFVVVLGSYCCSKASSQSFLGDPQLFGPSEALVKDVIELKCQLLTYPNNETILLQLFKEGDRDKVLGEYTSLAGEVASFPLVIRAYHDGNLECVAKAQNNSNIEPTVSNIHYLKVIEPVEGATIDVLSGSVEFFEGETLEMQCTLTAGNYVSYKWLLNGQLVSQSRYDHLLINRTTSKDSGSYVCFATNQFNKTEVFTFNSSEVVITVKELVSNPDIAFTVLKEHSHIYSAMVTCQSAKGTPPIIFSLYNRTEMVDIMMTEERNATFKVALVLGQHMGWFQCQANNGGWVTYSKEIPLEVVPVGGPVMMHYDYDIGENYAVISLRFYCKVAKGSLPRYQWFLNKTLLDDRGIFYYVVNQPPEQSMLLLSVEGSITGLYHCEVSDSFDNTTTISSKRHYLDKDGLNRLPLLLVAIVFGCFTVLVLLVSVCCGIGVVMRKRQYKEKPLLVLEMDTMVVANEGELDLSEYNEDAEVVTAARGGEFDQASEASVDEWPHTEEEGETLEDEPVEAP